jgi:hypothetical protein
MKKLALKFWFWALVQACIVAAFVGWRFYMGVSEYLAHPPDGDLYAHTWPFQFIVFLIFTLPKIGVSVIALLGAEWFVVRVISRRQVLDEKSSPAPSGCNRE